MRTCQDALMIACCSLLGLISGCGAIFHASQTLTVKTRPEDRALVYYDQALATPLNAAMAPAAQAQIPIFLNHVGTIVAASPGKQVATAIPATRLDGVAILLDTLWCLTIVGVAAPISDAVLGTFSKTSTQITLELSDDPEQDYPLPTYAIEGETFSAAEPPSDSERLPLEEPVK